MDVLINLIKIIGVFSLLMGLVSVMTWVERRLSAIIQYRLGPNRVGPFGLLQPIADGIKFIQKEDIIPAEAHKVFYVLAPALAVIPALCAFAVIPFGPTVTILGQQVKLVILDLDGGLLWAFAATGLGVYAIVLAGWSSNSKFSLIGGLRSSAQMVSYELPMALAVASVVLVSGTLRPTEIVAQQAGAFWHWNALKGGWQLLGFVIFTIAGYAETNRTPFDLPMSEAELVAGFHTEYSAMTFGLFFLGEYANMILLSALGSVLFLGGWMSPIPYAPFTWVPGIVWFCLKIAMLLFVFSWTKGTLPRYRYDQLMRLGWKVFLPVSLGWVVITAAVLQFGGWVPKL